MSSCSSPSSVAVSGRESMRSKSASQDSPQRGAESGGAVRARYNSHGVTIGLKYSYTPGQSTRGRGEWGDTLESTTVLSGHAMIQKTSHSAKLATFAGLSFPNANRYGFFPLARTISRNFVIKFRYPPFPSVPTMIPTVPASRAFCTAT